MKHEYAFNNTINHGHIEGPFDFHLVQVNKQEVYVYDHGNYLFKTKIPRVDPKYGLIVTGKQKKWHELTLGKKKRRRCKT